MGDEGARVDHQDHGGHTQERLPPVAEQEVLDGAQSSEPSPIVSSHGVSFTTVRGSPAKAKVFDEVEFSREFEAFHLLLPTGVPAVFGRILMIEMGGDSGRRRHIRGAP